MEKPTLLVSMETWRKIQSQDFWRELGPEFERLEGWTNVIIGGVVMLSITPSVKDEKKRELSFPVRNPVARSIWFFAVNSTDAEVLVHWTALLEAKERA